jgi:hypothetical protein
VGISLGTVCTVCLIPRRLVFRRLGGWLRGLQILSDTGFGAHRGISTHG